MIHNRTKITIHLIRHGQCEGNVNNSVIGGQSYDSPLTQLGEEQARYLQQSRVLHSVDVVYSSPQPRAHVTAKLVFPSMPIIPQNDLVEMSQGDYEGKSRKETYTTNTLLYINTKGTSFIPPNGESIDDTEMRISGWLNREILRNHKYINQNTTIAIITHGMVIKTLLHYIMGFDRSLIRKVEIDNATISTVMFDNEGWHVIRINK